MLMALPTHAAMIMSPQSGCDLSSLFVSVLYRHYPIIVGTDFFRKRKILSDSCGMHICKLVIEVYTDPILPDALAHT